MYKNDAMTTTWNVISESRYQVQSRLRDSLILPKRQISNNRIIETTCDRNKIRMEGLQRSANTIPAYPTFPIFFYLPKQYCADWTHDYLIEHDGWATEQGLVTITHWDMAD
jgi:hypothetical protein